MPKTMFSIVRYHSGPEHRFGILVDGSVHDIATIIPGPIPTSWAELLEQLERLVPTVVDALTGGVADGTPVSSVDVQPPVDGGAAIFGAGANFHDHNAAMAKALSLPPQPDPRELGLGPWFFLKVPQTVVGPDAEVGLVGEKMDWEAEIAVVIGKPARDVPVESALSHVAGYTIANDLSARDRGIRQPLSHGSPFRPDWVAHKNFDGACPVGPGIVPASFVGDPQALGIKLWVNGDIRQDSSSAMMAFSVAEQISHLSKLVTLRPGDVILTGTPAGTGAETGRFLNRGDLVRIEIDRLGSLETRIA